MPTVIIARFWVVSTSFSARRARMSNVEKPVRKYVRRKPLATPSQALMRQVQKYGAEFAEDLEALKTRQFWTLTEMGKKYGITRERVRQIFKRTYGESFRTYQKKKTKDLRAELRTTGCKFHPINKLQLSKGLESNISKGLAGEVLVAKKAQEFGYEVNGYTSTVVDMQINGYAVEIKTCFCQSKTVKGAKVRYYRAAISKKQLGILDYLIVVVPMMSAFYIIPREHLGAGPNIYIPTKKSTASNAQNRYHQFRDAWHLLKRDAA
jgi:AraC-like DNA-binding protein